MTVDTSGRDNRPSRRVLMYTNDPAYPQEEYPDTETEYQVAGISTCGHPWLLACRFYPPDEVHVRAMADSTPCVACAGIEKARKAHEDLDWDALIEAWSDIVEVGAGLYPTEFIPALERALNALGDVTRRR